MRGYKFMTEKKSTKKYKKNKSSKNIIKYIFLTIFLAVFFGAGATTGLVAALVKDEPVRSPEEIRKAVGQNSETGFVYFSNLEGDDNYTLAGTLRASEDRRPVKFNEISPNVINAFLAVEDRAFYEHYGINPKALVRAVLQQALHSDVQTGGSTITQQLAKNTFFSFEKSYTRKAREIFLALRMERILGKDDIFTAYLNKIPFGKAANYNNVYGIQAASKGYFNKNASELNLAESAFLAGIPQRPTAYSSFNSEGFDEEGYDLATKRQKLVLKSMLNEGFINQQDYDDALTYDIKEAFASSQQSKAYTKYPYLMLEVESRAAEKLLETQGVTEDAPDYSQIFESTKQELLTGGYRVYTTIDKNVYEKMNDVAKNPKNFSAPRTYTFKYANDKVKRIEDAFEQVGATLIQNKTGAILGFIGGRDYNVSSVNHSNFRGTTKRQSGSSIKPILDYAPALELGKIQPASPIDDTPLGGKWEPKNWDNKYHGRISARTALNQSYNIPAIKTYEKVGTENGYDFLSKMGFNMDKKRFLQAGLTPAIGTMETSPEEMTRAYTTLANDGTYVDAYLIERIEDKDGNIVYEHESQPEIVFSEQTAFLITDMLRSVITDGTAKSIRSYVGYSRDVAGKTGTSNGYRDLWFVGYTPEITLGVWAGYDYPTDLRYKSIAKDTWGRIMKEVTAADPNLSPANSKFKMPSGIVKMQVSSMSGKLPSELTNEAGYLVTDWFNKKFIPTEVDDSLEKARVVVFNEKKYLAKEETPDDMVNSGIFFKREPYEMPVGLPKPPDYDKELPNEVDPRTSNGQINPPSNPLVKLQGSKNTLSWDKDISENIVGYRIYRGSSFGFGFQNIGVVKQDNLKPGRFYYEDTSGSSGNSYYITAVDVGGNESGPSTTVGNGSITSPVNPDNPQDNGNQSLPDPLDNTDNQVNQNSAGDGSNEPSPELSKVTKPSKPAGLKVSKYDSGLQISLSWKANPKEEQVSKYNVYFSTVENGPFDLIGSTENTSFVHPSVPVGDVYYQIKAVNEKGESGPSKTVKVSVKNID